MEQLEKQTLTHKDIQYLNECLHTIKELELVVKEYNQLKHLVKEYVYGHDKVVTEDFVIEGKFVDRKEYTVKATTFYQWKSKAKPTVKAYENAVDRIQADMEVI